MKRSYSKTITVPLSDDGSAYIKVDALSLDLQAKLSGADSAAAQVELIKELVKEMKGIEVDGKEVSLEEVGQWPMELVTDVLKVSLEAVAKKANPSEATEEEKN